MKNKFVVWIAPVALAGALALPAAAQSQDPSGSGSAPAASSGQTAAPAKNPNATPGINKRQRNQQRRIRQGVKSGELTKSETRHLEKEEGKIEADKLEAKSDGSVTPAERAKLQREENHASRDIYRKKHNARTAPPKKEPPTPAPPQQ